MQLYAIGKIMPARIEEHLKKVIRKRFSASYMSNAKWRKLFTALDPLKIEQAYWKFVDLDDEFRDRFVEKEDLMEKFVGDCGVGGGPFAYRRIEWVEIPKIGKNPMYENVPHMNFEQDITKVQRILDEIGCFETEQTARGIRIYGHK